MCEGKGCGMWDGMGPTNAQAHGLQHAHVRAAMAGAAKAKAKAFWAGTLRFCKEQGEETPRP